MSYDPTSFAKASGVLFRDVNKATSSVSDVSLSSFSVPANTLFTNGESLRVTVLGQITGTGTATIHLKFGATDLFNTGALAVGNFKLDCVLGRLSGTTQVSVTNVDAGTTLSLTRATPGETLANAITLDFRGSV